MSSHFQYKAIHSWPCTEQPREKLIQGGPQSLSDSELLAIFLRTGIPGKSAVEVGREALACAGDLRSLLNMQMSDLCEIPGIGPAKYALLQAALELGRRYLQVTLARDQILSDPTTSKQYLSMMLRDKPYEAFFCIYLDSKHRVMHCEELFRGTIDNASVPLREVVKDALKHNASALIVAHNHPSGVAEPSLADKRLTGSLKAVLELVNVRLLDHFIVGDGEVTSLAEMGVLG